MKVSNMTNERGNKVANQFIIIQNTEKGVIKFFQSYNSIIVKIVAERDNFKIILDDYYWNCSRTTSKYRSLFLGETTKETQKKINDGIYILENLN